MFQSAGLDFRGIPRPAFGRAAQHLPAHQAPKKIRGLARYQRAAKTAAELLPDLPAPGEAIHVLMTGQFDLAQVIAAVVRRTPCRHLRIATLCYSRRNAAELCGLLESRAADPLPLTFLVSEFFTGHNKELHEWFREQLAPYPSVRLGAARSHCKIALFDLGPGDGLVFEGSANLRTNGNREQLTVIRDRAVHDWHAGWIDSLVVADGSP
ncbi:MAG: hypothetical protein JWO38_6382 [Gemmataceae bacterium]|nr:hypothetical protein [Gemmataceae bacterium]